MSGDCIHDFHKWRFLDIVHRTVQGVLVVFDFNNDGNASTFIVYVIVCDPTNQARSHSKVLYGLLDGMGGHGKDEGHIISMTVTPQCVHWISGVVMNLWGNEGNGTGRMTRPGGGRSWGGHHNIVGSTTPTGLEQASGVFKSGSEGRVSEHIIKLLEGAVV